MKAVFFIFGVIVALLTGCQDTDEGQLTANEYIATHAEQGVVNVVEKNGFVEVEVVDVETKRFDATPEISGIVAVTTTSLTTGCFGYSWCVRIDDPSRGVIRKATGDIEQDDIVIYGEVDAPNPPTGVTYTNNINYDCFGSSAPTHAAIRGLLVAHGQGADAARAARCASPVFEDTCYQD